MSIWNSTCIVHPILLMWMPSNFDLYFTFHNGQIQRDSAECLMMLIEIINKGSVPCGSNDNSTEVSLSDLICIYFTVGVKKWDSNE